MTTSPESLLNPSRMAPAIQHSRDSDGLPNHPVIDGKREPSGEKAVIAEVPGVNACVESEGVNVRKQGIEKIVAEAGRLGLIEAKAFD
jgi:hypothetical protein